MASRNDALEQLDSSIAKLEAVGNLSELERVFQQTVEAFPFIGAAYSWWSYPPPAREPDYRLSSGAVRGGSEPPAEFVSDPWAVSLPVIKFETVGENDPAEVTVGVIAPRRRLGVLKAVLLVDAGEIRARSYDWRGRFLILAHVMQHHIGSWRSDERPALGRREIQCLKLAAEGLKAKQIASALGIGQQTVQFHLSRAREKLNCSNTVQAVALAAQYGLLPDIDHSPAPDA